MNHIQFFNSFQFKQLHFQRFHFTDHLADDGAPTNYLAVMIRGTAKLKAQRGALELAEGDVFYIPKGCRYQSFWYGDAQERISWLSFGFDHFPMREDHDFTFQKVPCSQRAKELLSALSQDIKVHCRSVGLLYQFLGEVSGEMEQDRKPYGRTIEKALEFMEKTDRFLVKDVAAYCCVSESGLYKIFKKALDQTPIEIRQKISCEKAADLLTTTNLSIEEISDRLGFSSSSYFRKVFKKHTGQTPREIRKKAEF